MAAPTTTDLALHMGADPPAQPSAAWSARLSSSLAAAIEAVELRVLSDWVDGTNAYPEAVRYAILIVGAQLFGRGNAGTGTLGTVDPAGIIERDADVSRLLGPYLDLSDRFA